MIEMKNWKRSVAFLTLALVVGLLCGGLAWAAKPPKPPPPPPPPTVSYSLVMLGTLGGTNSWAEDVNAFGDVVGGAGTTPDGHRHAFLYTAELGMEDLNDVAPVPDGWVLDIAYGINDLGQIVGNSGSRGFRYTPAGDQVAEFLDLGALGMSGAHAINDFGDVAGTCFDAEGRERVCLYTDDGGLIQLPLTSDGRLWRPRAINNARQIVGYTTTVRKEAVRYTPGVGVIPLGTIKQVVDAEWSEGMDINDAGQVVGRATVRRLTSHAFRYTDAVGMKDLGTLGGSSSFAFGINSAGDVVGWSQTAAGEDAIFLYTNADGMVNLSTSIDPDDVPVDFHPGAERINDSGVICGTGAYADGTQEANLLIPVPTSP